jgi:cyclophilin family peptidyl-prolyl cis-trans isomerase
LTTDRAHGDRDDDTKVDKNVMARNRRGWLSGGWAGLELLEHRELMAAPAIDLIPNASVPSNKSLIVPITASDGDGDTLSYTVQSDNGAVTGQIYHGTIDLKLTVAGFGDMTFQLLPQFAPNTVNTIVGLVNSGFYNNLTFHRIISAFMIQGGDPNGDGTGGPGFQYDDEFNPEAIFSGAGQLAMANSGKDTNGSQFFVTVSPQRSLDFDYTIFGQLERGFDVLNAINAVATDPANNRPLTPVVITNASIVADPTDAVLILNSNSSGSSTITVTANDGHGNEVASSFKATTVADATNDPPILGPVGNVVSATNTPINLTLSSTDLENSPVGYGAAVDDSTTNATTSVVGNIVTVTPKTGYQGNVQIIVGVRQATGNTRFDTEVVTVTFKDQALSAQAVAVAAVEGTATAAPLARFTAAVPFTASNFTASVDWGDGTMSAGVIKLDTGGQYEVLSTKSYPRFGSYPFSVTIHDLTTGTVTTTSGTATVTDAPLSSQFTASSTTAGTPTISGTIATVTDGNLQGLAADLSAMIDWGDGSTTAGTIVPQSAGTFAVVGSKTYAAQGSYPVKVAITSLGGSTTSTQGTIISGPNTVNITAPPTVQIVKATTTKKKGAITAVILQINGPLNALIASNPAIFTIVTAGRDKKFGTRDDVVTRFKVASYSGNQITLTPAKRLVLAKTSQLRVLGLRDVYGRAISNNPGNLFIATVVKSGVISISGQA